MARARQIDDNTCTVGEGTRRGCLHCDYVFLAYDKPLAIHTECTARKLEDELIWMIKPAHLGLHELTEPDYHVDAIGGLCDLHAKNGRTRIGRTRETAFLRNRRRYRNQDDYWRKKRRC